MRIVSVVKTNTGAEWAFRQSLWLCKHGVEVITILPFKSGGMAEQYISAGMKVVEFDMSLPVNNPFLFLARRAAIKEMINKLKPDIIHSHFVTNILMLRFALGKTSSIPRIFQVPGPLHLEHIFYRKLDILTSGAADYWIGSCKKTCDIYKTEGVSSNRVFLSYYGSYQRKWQELSGDGRLRKQFKIEKNVILVSLVAYIYKPKKYLMQFKGIKGHEDFIEAIRLVKTKYPNVVGLIIGGPWGKSVSYEKKLRDLAFRKCGQNIIFTGYRNDVNIIYREIDIAVFPSHSENLGGAAESLCFCVPTIATNIGGFPDIVIDEKTGKLVPPNSPKDIAQAICSFIENPVEAKKMAERGRQLVAKMLDIENTAQTVFNVYQEIMQQQGHQQ